MTSAIRDGISLLLAQVYPEIAVYGDERIAQGLETPCFFVGMGEQTLKTLPCGMWQMRQFVDVTYFPKTQMDYVELWAVGPQVMELLQRLRLADGTMARGKGFSCSVSEGLMYVRGVYTLRLVRVEGDKGKMDKLRLNFVTDQERE